MNLPPQAFLQLAFQQLNFGFEKLFIKMVSRRPVCFYWPFSEFLALNDSKTFLTLAIFAISGSYSNSNERSLVRDWGSTSLSLSESEEIVS